MIHGLNNTYLYSAKMIIAHWTNGKDTVELRGTGFFVDKEGELALITNRHVVEPGYSDRKFLGYTVSDFLVVGYQAVDENGIPCDLHIAKINNFLDSCFSANVHNDIACIKKVQLGNGSATVICPIPYSLLATKEQLEKLSVCDSIAYPGFPEWYDRKNETPIFRMGTIASDPRLNYSYDKSAPIADRVAYEGFSSGGASGSPIFSVQKGFQIGGGLEYSGDDEFYRSVKLIGINAGHFSDQKGHSGISYFYKSSAILEILDTI